jgi:hypothetical protein
VPSNKELNDAWVADGTPNTEPVTTETPTIETGPVETPATDTAPLGETPTPVADPTPVTLAEFIEARRGEEPFQLPKDVLVPVTRHGKTEFIPITESLTSTMLERDYRIKTSETADRGRALDLREAQIKAEQDELKAERDRLEDALRDQTKFDAYQEHLRQLAENPMYAQAFDDARAKRQADAKVSMYESRDRAEAVERGVQTVRTLIEDMAPQYPGVNQDRVRARYADYLQAAKEDVELTPAQIRADLTHLYADERAYVEQVRQPVSTELETLKQQIADLQKAMQRTNDQTTHAVNRTKQPLTAPLGVAPGPGTREPPKPFQRRDLITENQRWARGE